MQSLPSTWSQKALLALLATTACLQATANPMLGPQASLAPPEDGPLPESMQQQLDPEADQYPPDAEAQAGAFFPIAYGHCYYFTDPMGSHLGSDYSTWSRLKFNSNNHRRPFRLCKDHDDCSERGYLHHRGTFYLEDYLGSEVANGKNILAADVGAYVYPGFRNSPNHLNFRAYSDCDISYNRDCYVRLGLTGQKHNGLEINAGGHLMNRSNKEHTTVSVQFNRVECPDYHDRVNSEL